MAVHEAARVALDGAAAHDINVMTEGLDRLDKASIQVLEGLDDLAATLKNGPSAAHRAA